MSNQHVLKIHPAPLADLLSGAKTAEVRRNDRDFQVGDTVRLMEVNPETGNWTGAADHIRTISHIQTGYGLPEGVCVLSYAQAEQQEAQGAQAGEFQREDRYIVIKRKDLEAIERSGEASDLETHEAVRFLAEALDTLRPHLPARECLVIERDWPEYEPTWAAIQARAALATQPAAGEPKPIGYISEAVHQELLNGKHVPANICTATPSRRNPHPGPDANWSVPIFAAPPAPPHGDEAVRKDAEAAYIEMTCQPVLIDGAHHYYLSSERMQAFDRLFSVDVSDAAMRAQGDGGSGDA